MAGSPIPWRGKDPMETTLEKEAKAYWEKWHRDQRKKNRRYVRSLRRGTP